MMPEDFANELNMIETVRNAEQAARRDGKLPITTRVVCVESPWAGDIDRNIAYLRACMRDCLQRGEVPFASHGMYAALDVLDDSIATERALGIQCGLLIKRRCDVSVVYTDLGISAGMKMGIDASIARHQPVEFRKLTL